MKPTEINLHQRSRILEISFEDGNTFKLSYEYLRVHSPSAEVQGHGPGQGVLQLSGPPEVLVIVDGIERGPLPVELVVDQGRHLVRYEYQGRRIVRFYFVKAGATRVLELITRPGGFVDAR